MNYTKLEMLLFPVLLLLMAQTYCVLGGENHGKHLNDNTESCSKEDKSATAAEMLCCSIAIPRDDEDERCKHHRVSVLEEKRKYYRLTTRDGARTIEFPWGNAIPFINQTMDAVKSFTLRDEVDSRWIKSFAPLAAAAKQTGGSRYVVAKNRTFDEIADYKDLYKEHAEGIKAMNKSFVSNPATDSNTFTPFLDAWDSDDMFVQQRLAGPCPFLLKHVTGAGDEGVGMRWDQLRKLLNQTYDFDGAVNRALGTVGDGTLNEHVANGDVYVLYENDSDDVKTKPRDSFHQVTGRSLMNVTSPITLLALTPRGDLKLVAIQMDSRNTSEVFSPASDAESWMMAKSMVNLVEQNYCQSVWHLSHVHFSSSVYCNIFQSHFSDLHPLFQIMRHHCEGTTPHIALSWPIVAPQGPIDKFSAVGNEEVVRVALKTKRNHYHYGLLAYDELLRTRGLDSQRIRYHPFREDGKILWEAFQLFAEDFVDVFYRSDADVAEDEELQSFANEVSAEGRKAPFGGRGGVRGFPAEFRTRGEVVVFVKRFIWLVAMHAAVNYPMEPWYTFVPLSPSKLYVDASAIHSDPHVHTSQDAQSNAHMHMHAHTHPHQHQHTHEHQHTHSHQHTHAHQHQHTHVHNLPDGPTSAGYIAFMTSLGNFRINRIMDHAKKVRGLELKGLVQHHHSYLHTVVQKELETRNAARKAERKMGFQYFEPKWLTNSIHV